MQRALARHPVLSDLSVTTMEGLLFADTYHFSKKSSHTTVVNAFVNGLINNLVTTYLNTSKPSLSFYDTLILASIIEKEAGTQSEMRLISGVFHNRLKKNMLLASCPTVGYAMGQPRKKSLTYRDLKTKSPYNTYLHRGLPPSPIAAPSKAAFLAALSPESTKYYYFVAKNNGTGTHVFSTNLTDHLAAQKRILNQ